MISSAVVIPDNGTETSSPTLKRRQSSISEDSNKRPRIASPNESSTNGAREETTSNGAMSPPAKRRSLGFGSGVGAAEEKRRGQRLFGSLLGTLSQTSAKPAHKKRDEIEARQRERLKKDDEERVEEHRRKKAEFDKSRWREQQLWEEESLNLRHRNMRAKAGFLMTKTEPRLYYKPWEWREEEEQQIKQQQSDVEDIIQRETSEHATGKASDSGHDREMISPSAVEITVQDESHTKHLPNGDRESDADQTSGEHAPDVSSSEHGSRMDTEEQHLPADDPKKDSGHEKQNHDDHHGEELVEGQEDDVIY